MKLSTSIQARAGARVLVSAVLACAGCNGSDTTEPTTAVQTGGSGGSAGGADAAPEAQAGSGGDAAAEGSDAATEAEASPETDSAGDAPSEAQPETSTKTGCIQGDFQPYFGLFHDHTSYSDGEQKPSDAFAYARNQAHLDIMVVTDHLEQVMIPTRWADCKSMADDANVPGTFVAACGYEYATFSTPPLSTGHNNIFFDSALMDPSKWDVSDVYSSLIACATCIGQFNHPGSEDGQTWNDFEYNAAADEKLNLFEFNGGGPVWDLFFLALNKGWHVSPMNDQDNHSANWGTADDHRSGVFMSSLTRVGLAEAMHSRRTFQSLDKNATLRIMADQDCWMGSVLKGYGKVGISMEAKDADATDAFTLIELFAPDKQVVSTIDCQSQQACSGTATVDAGALKFVVARATQADGDTLVSAPIWFE
jgi:hypothetical protein